MTGLGDRERDTALPASNKLHLFDSPLVDEQEDSRRSSAPIHLSIFETNRSGTSQDIPRFRRYEEPTLLELFLDLFFAANYEVFGENQHVTDHSRFQAYVGYFCLLWLTWFIVALYDVRFVTDSIFARAMRAIQLGVLVGFTVITPKFDTAEQDAKTMRTTSIILAISRFSLGAEYACTLWRLRRFTKMHMPLLIQVSIHAVSAAILLGLAFDFEEGHPSRVFIVWYVVAGIEAVASLLLSNMSPVVSLTETHLMKRLTLMTVMILGSSISEVAKKVVVIVKNAHAWEPTTIGHITAAVAVIYFIFLVYFDWMRCCLHLPPVRLQIWTALHFPFNLSLVLFLQAIQQYVIWGKLTAQLTDALDIAYPLDDPNLINNSTTSASVAAALNGSVTAFLELYPYKISSTWETIEDALGNISSVPNSFWPIFRTLNLEAPTSEVNRELLALPDSAKQQLQIIVDAALTLGVTMSNALFSNFGIEVEGDIVKKNPDAAKGIKGGGFQFEVQTAALNLYRLVFAYGYVTCGCTIVFMVILTALVRTRPQTPWQIARLVIITALGIGVGVTATLWFSYERAMQFLLYAWVLPTVTIVWTVILILTHVNGRGTKQCVEYFRRRRMRKSGESPPRLSRSTEDHAEKGDGVDAEMGRTITTLGQAAVDPGVVDVLTSPKNKRASLREVEVTVQEGVMSTPSSGAGKP